MSMGDSKSMVVQGTVKMDTRTQKFIIKNGRTKRVAGAEGERQIRSLGLIYTHYYI